MRNLRQPPDQTVFDQRDIPTLKSASLRVLPWYRLYRKEFAGQFFPSRGSRLTPDSGDYPCVYLALSEETTVAEVWGDRLSAQRDLGGDVFVIPSDQAKRWAYLELSHLPVDLKICDLFDADTRLALGIDSGSLYTTDLAFPQAWAQRIACHPARFDGIRYRSRHTDEGCLVLWSRADDAVPLSTQLRFRAAGEFIDSDAAYILAGKIGIRLAFS